MGTPISAAEKPGLTSPGADTLIAAPASNRSPVGCGSGAYPYGPGRNTSGSCRPVTVMSPALALTAYGVQTSVAVHTPAVHAGVHSAGCGRT